MINIKFSSVSGIEIVFQISIFGDNVIVTEISTLLAVENVKWRLHLHDQHINIFQIWKVHGSVRIAIFLPTVTQCEKFLGLFKRK